MGGAGRGGGDGGGVRRGRRRGRKEGEGGGGGRGWRGYAYVRIDTAGHLALGELCRHTVFRRNGWWEQSTASGFWAVARGGGRGRRAGERADGRHPGAGVVSTAANPVDRYPYGHVGRAGLSAGNKNRHGGPRLGIRIGQARCARLWARGRMGIWDGGRGWAGGGDC